MKCSLYAPSILITNRRHRFVKLRNRLLEVRIFLFLSSFSHGIFSHLMPKRWEWWIQWILKRDKRCGQDGGKSPAGCSLLAVFFPLGNAEIWWHFGRGLRGWAQLSLSWEREIGDKTVMVLALGCCCGEQATAIAEFSPLLLWVSLWTVELGPVPHLLSLERTLTILRGAWGKTWDPNAEGASPGCVQEHGCCSLPLLQAFLTTL